MPRPHPPIEAVEGDTTPHLIVDCVSTDANGVQAAQDITGWTFQLFLARPDPSPVLVKDGEILDAAAGKVAFTWDPGDFREGQGQVAYITMVDGTGETRSFGNFIINVAKKPTPP